MSKAIGVLLWYFSVGRYVLLTVFIGGRIFVGEEKIEVDLGVVDGVGGNHFVEVVPLSHDLLVLREVG